MLAKKSRHNWHEFHKTTFLENRWEARKQDTLWYHTKRPSFCIAYIPSVFLKKKTCSVFFFLNTFFLKKTLLKKNKGQNVFFSKPPVFKVNIHNLSQFVNHTVTLVQNKNNNERLLWNEGYAAGVWKKNVFFQTMFILEKKLFLKIWFFSSVLFF